MKWLHGPGRSARSSASSCRRSSAVRSAIVDASAGRVGGPFVRLAGSPGLLFSIPAVRWCSADRRFGLFFNWHSRTERATLPDAHAPHPRHRDAGRHQPLWRRVRRLADGPDGPRLRLLRLAADAAARRSWSRRTRSSSRRDGGRRRAQRLCRAAEAGPHLAAPQGRSHRARSATATAKPSWRKASSPSSRSTKRASRGRSPVPSPSPLAGEGRSCRAATAGRGRAPATTSQCCANARRRMRSRTATDAEHRLWSIAPRRIGLPATNSSRQHADRTSTSSISSVFERRLIIEARWRAACRERQRRAARCISAERRAFASCASGTTTFSTNEEGVAEMHSRRLFNPSPRSAPISLSREGRGAEWSNQWLTPTTSSSSAPGPAAMSPRSARRSSASRPRSSSARCSAGSASTGAASRPRRCCARPRCSTT